MGTSSVGDRYSSGNSYCRRCLSPFSGGDTGSRGKRGPAPSRQPLCTGLASAAARDALADAASPPSAERRNELAEELRRIVRNETALASELFTLTQSDSRIGFEASNQYDYLPLDLVEKVVNCRYVLDRLAAE